MAYYSQVNDFCYLSQLSDPYDPNYLAFECSDEENIYSMETVVVETLVETQYVGAIIGTKGGNIRWIERLSEVTINVSNGPASDPSDSLITVTGTLKAIRNAYTLLTETVYKYSYPMHPTFKLIVHNDQCGRIIGSGGHTIRKIEHSSGASLQVCSSAMSYRHKRKVIIVGDSESITQCLIDVVKIMIKFPVSNIITSIDQTHSFLMPSASGATFSWSNEIDPISYSRISTSSTSSSSYPNMAGPSTSKTPTLEEASSLDSTSFGKLVASELQKMNTSNQSQLRKEILASIAKFKNAEMNSRLNDNIDDCAICLEKVTDKAFSGECLHVFCFRCISQWINVKTTCPICVRRIKTILHSIKSNDRYEVLNVEPAMEEIQNTAIAFSGFMYMV